MTHIISKLTIIGSDNGLLPGRRQAIIWTNAGILFIQNLGINFSEILSKIPAFSFKKMHFKMSPAKGRLFSLGLNELMSTVFPCHAVMIWYIPQISHHILLPIRRRKPFKFLAICRVTKLALRPRRDPIWTCYPPDPPLHQSPMVHKCFISLILNAQYPIICPRVGVWVQWGAPFDFFCFVLFLFFGGWAKRKKMGYKTVAHTFDSQKGSAHMLGTV